MKQRFSKRTRLVSALLTLAMVFTFLPFSAFAATDSYGPVYITDANVPDKMLMYGREAQSKTRIASPATIPKSGERNRKIHSCMLYLISI